MEDIYSYFLDQDNEEKVLDNKDKNDLPTNKIIYYPISSGLYKGEIEYFPDEKKFKFSLDGISIQTNNKHYKGEYKLGEKQGYITDEKDNKKEFGIEDFIKKLLLDRDINSVEFLKDKGISIEFNDSKDLMFEPDEIKNEKNTGEELDLENISAEKILGVLKSILRSVEFKNSFVEYISDILEVASKKWDKDEYVKLVRGLMNEFPEYIGEFIVKDLSNIFFIPDELLGLLEEKSIEDFISKLKEYIINSNDTELKYIMNKYLPISKLLPNKDLNNFLKDYYSAKTDINIRNKKYNSEDILGIIDKKSEDDIGKILLNNYKDIINSENSYVNFLKILEKKPGLIKYLRPYDQKVEFQKLVLSKDPKLAEFIYIMSYGLADEITDKYPELIMYVLSPKDWKEFYSSTVVSKQDGWLGTKSKMLGTTPIPMSETEIHKLRSKVISMDPLLLIEFPDPTEYEQELALNGIKSKVKIIDLFKGLKEKGVRISSALDRAVEKALGV